MAPLLEEWGWGYGIGTAVMATYQQGVSVSSQLLLLRKPQPAAVTRPKRAVSVWQIGTRPFFCGKVYIRWKVVVGIGDRLQWSRLARLDSQHRLQSFGVLCCDAFACQQLSRQVQD